MHLIQSHCNTVVLRANRVVHLPTVTQEVQWLTAYKALVGTNSALHIDMEAP